MCVKRYISILDPEEPEFLDFDFGDVLLSAVSVTFGRVGSDDEFRLVTGINPPVTGDIPGGFGNFDNDLGTVDFTFAQSVTGFRFTTTDLDDDYSILGFTVETIPTPALLPGLLGMGAAALRKRRNEATEAEA